MSELDEKIARLPTWAREHIRKLATRSEPAVEEAARCRTALETAKERLKKASEAIEALMELIRCAGRGGSDWAKVVVDTLDSYEIFKPSQAAKEGQ